MTAAKQLNNPPKTEKKHKGNPNLKPGPGRPKGSQNKLTKTVKQAVLDAFEELGGAEWLASVAREDPKTFAHFSASGSGSVTCSRKSAEPVALASSPSSTTVTAL